MGNESGDSGAESRAVITWDSAGAPLGKFLLIRRGGDACALRFTTAHRGHDAKPQTLTQSGEETFFAEYEWFYQGDGSSLLTGPGVRSGRGKLEKKPLRGIGRLAFQTGETYVKCGPFTLLWTYPTSVSFYSGSNRGDQGIEMAPTKWSSVLQIDFQNPHLKWYRYDEDRSVTYIPIDAL